MLQQFSEFCKLVLIYILADDYVYREEKKEVVSDVATNRSSIPYSDTDQCDKPSLVLQVYI